MSDISPNPDMVSPLPRHTLRRPLPGSGPANLGRVTATLPGLGASRTWGFFLLSLNPAGA